ncbi:MAG: GNAT family N-acetyltransferase [Prochlorotrichaceae cyanobacterium]
MTILSSAASSLHYRLTWIDQVAQVPQEQWDALAHPLPTPFFAWDWLHNLESSGSATADAGWQPCHLVVWREELGHAPRLVAAAPLYVKGHSYGEFVFDHQWADLAYRLGLDYYPKLLGMSPFTPAVGYRFLMDPLEDELTLTRAMLNAIDQFCDRNRILGCHFLYVDEAWKPLLENNGYLTWMHHNSVWQNQGFQTFEDYLKMFNANQRRNIKRERKAMQTAGLTLKTFSGEEIPHHFFSDIYWFYSDHCDKFGWWGSKYLTKSFFEKLHHNFRDRLLFVAAFDQQHDDRHPVGMSFCVHKGDRLYGRYWGSRRDYDCLHFNACYYSPIEWAIDRNIQIFDPGAGGSHKKRRGFPATPHYSLHRLYDDRFRHILSPYLEKVNEVERQEIEAINQELPFTRPEITIS